MCVKDVVHRSYVGPPLKDDGSATPCDHGNLDAVEKASKVDTCWGIHQGEPGQAPPCKKIPVWRGVDSCGRKAEMHASMSLVLFRISVALSLGTNTRVC